MKFIQHFSSSEGNLYTLESGDSRIMIECGVSWKKIQKSLDFNIGNVDFCLVTHEHKDHCKSWPNVEWARIPVYASEGTHSTWSCGYDDMYVLTSLVFTHIGKWSVFPFATHHDCIEPQGFIISDGKENMLFATDTFMIEERFAMKFDIISIECSYDKDILLDRLDNGQIDEMRCKRLLKSHMEKRTTLSYLQTCCNLKKCREVHLLHMSKENLDRDKTVKEFEESLMIKIITV